MAEDSKGFEQEENFPPVFWSELTEQDRRVLLSIAGCKNFDLDFVYAVARRCRHGFPQILACRPFMSDGTPFPTLFWLICPYLDKRCAELEAQHKIPELERELENCADAVTHWHEKYAKLRKKIALGMDLSRVKNLDAVLKSFEKYGVGGINISNPCTAKCLHLQTATMLAWQHPCAAWLSAQIGKTECQSAECKNCAYKRQ